MTKENKDSTKRIIRLTVFKILAVVCVCVVAVVALTTIN